MHTPIRTLPAILMILLVFTLQLGCSLSSVLPSSSAPGAGGLSGRAQVSVSDGVLLLTPGAPLPTPEDYTPFGLTPPAATATPDPNITPSPAPTSDASALQLPAGVALYPGATGLDTTGLTASLYGTSFIQFYVHATPSDVIAWYHQTLEPAGWSAIPAVTPSPTLGGGAWTMGTQTLNIVVKVNTKTGTMVMITWTK